jgi:hypothetical protein
MLPTPTRYALIKGCHAFPIAACERLVIPAWRTSAAVCFLQFPRLFSTKRGLLRALSALGRGGARLFERFAEKSRNLQCRLQAALRVSGHLNKAMRQVVVMHVRKVVAGGGEL